MKQIDILLQGADIADIEIISLPAGSTYTDLLDEAARRREGGDGEFLIFLEDEEDPVEPKRKIAPSEPGRPHRVHVHRCRRIEVETSFNGESKAMSFAPGVTVGTAKRRIAQQLFGMDPKDAAEHVLQLAGNSERPEPDTHLGALVSEGQCRIAFDLVPLTRVEG
jgi:hypothetical protein